MKKVLTFALSILFIIFVGIGVFSLRSNELNTNITDVKLQDDLTELKALKLDKIRLNTEFDKAIKEKNIDADYIKRLEDEKIKSEERTRQLERELQAKAEAKAAQQTVATVGISEKASAAPAATWDGVCGDNAYAHEIYMQESGCRIGAVNSIGCIGIGQSCPASKLANVCPDWATNYACQNEFFTRYAMSYGSWKQAHDFKYCLGNCYSTRTNTTTYKVEIWW